MDGVKTIYHGVHDGRVVVERWQDCAWKATGSPYPPAFSYGPTHSCAYGSPGAQYYTPPYARYGYTYYPYGPYYYR